MRAVYIREGKAVAVVNNATHIASVGEFVFLKVGSDQSLQTTLFKVLMVAWNTELLKDRGVETPEFSEGDVYVLVEPARPASA